jgi:hypothetical protein
MECEETQCMDVLISLLQCLCIAPTYELALQIGKNVEDMGKFMTDLKIIYAVRGEKCEFLFVGWFFFLFLYLENILDIRLLLSMMQSQFYAECLQIISRVLFI